jgi:hypothetical protein
MITMARSVAEVKTVHTVEEKLKLRPDMKYLIDWCIQWMKSAPSLSKKIPFFVKKKGISYAKGALGLRWQQLLDYEKKGAADSITAEGGAIDDDGGVDLDGNTSSTASAPPPASST